MGAPAISAATPGYGPGDDFWYGAISTASASGMPITADTALAIAAVYACVRVIAEDIGSAPLHLFHRLPGGAKERILPADLPLAMKLAVEPNRDQTSMEWREMMMGHTLLRSNSYSQIIPGPSGFVEELVPLNPERMKVERLPNRARLYTYRDPEKGTMKFAQEEIFHLAGLSFDGLTGMSIVGVAREAMGVAAAAERYAAADFGQGLKPSGVLEHPGTLGREGMINLRESFMEANAGIANARKPVVLEEGMKWQQMGMTSEDAQFLESRKFQIEEIARFFRMPHHKIGIMEKATFSNIEQQAVEYVVDTLRPWVVRWEQRIQRQLIVRPDVFAEFQLDGFLRGDIKSRYEAYQAAITYGWLNVDEVRAKENLNPREGGDIYMRQANMVPWDTPADATRGLRGTGGASNEAHSPRLLLLAEERGARVVRKEVDRVSKAAKKYGNDAMGWEAFCADFYQDYGVEVTRALQLPEAVGVAYAQRQRAELLEKGVAVVEDWMADKPSELARMAIEGG